MASSSLASPPSLKKRGLGQNWENQSKERLLLYGLREGFKLKKNVDGLFLFHTAIANADEHNKALVFSNLRISL